MLFNKSIRILIIGVLFWSCGMYDLDRKEFLIVISTDEITNTGSSITAKGTISAIGKGAQEYGHVWSSTNEKPTIEDDKLSLGSSDVELTYTSEITDLLYNTQYYVRAYAYDGEEYFYGDVIQVTTSEATIVKTLGLNIFSPNTAELFGMIESISNEGIIDHGHCWSSTNNEPTIANDTTSLGMVSTVGSFSSLVTELSPNITYYYRSYAQMPNGNTVYGEVKTLIIELFAIDTTSNITIFDSSSFSVQSHALLAGYQLDEHGHCWSTSPNPTLNNNNTSLGAKSNTGGFTSTLTGLSTGNTYYLRAYGIAGDTTVYSPQQIIKITNVWIKKPNFGGVGRQLASSFSIGSKAYIGLGNPSSTFLEDFWEYDATTETWTQKANFGGGLRQRAVGFSIGNKGYIGTGLGVNGSFSDTKNDLWEYDPATNTWSQKANITGDRRSAVSFVIADKAYVGTGYNGSTNRSDLWEYNPTTNTWTQKAAFGGGQRTNAVAFSIGDKGYIGIGADGLVVDDFWEYNSTLNAWIQRASFGGGPRHLASAFAVKNKGYIMTGTGAGGARNDLWEYDPVTDIWTQKRDLPAPPRWSATAFEMNGKGYLGTGFGTGSGGGFLTDFWEYIPD